MKIKITHPSVFVAGKQLSDEVEIDDVVGKSLVGRGLATVVEETEKKTTKRRTVIKKDSTEQSDE